MGGDEVMTSDTEKFNDTDFGCWRKQIEDYLYGIELRLPLLGKRPKRMDSLPGNKTWELTELLSDKKTLHSKCVYRVKNALDGSKRYKTRLVEKDFQQRYNIVHLVGVVSRHKSNLRKSVKVQNYVNDDMSIKGVTLEKLRLCSTSVGLLA